MYAPFAMVFPEESGHQTLSFQLKARNPFGLPAGRYAIHDIYPALQEAPVYEVFLNLANANNEILATLYCQLDADAQQLHLSLSEIHLQQAQAPVFLELVNQLFQEQQGQNWADLLIERAEQMQAAFLEQMPQLSVSSPQPEDETKLLKGEILQMILGHYQDSQAQEEVLDALLAEIREQMQEELDSYRRSQEAANKIIRFPLERRQAAVDIHWLDLHLELMDLPQIWRKIRVPDNLSLSQMHRIIQAAMGWQNIHLWRFVHSRGEYVSYHEIEHIWEDELNADNVKLRELLIRKGSRLDYEYDFGDSWYHVLKVEQRHKPGSLNSPELSCLEGAGSCPPEDCGGYFGYQELLKAQKKKRKSKSDQALLSKMGNFDPQNFHSERINQELKSLCQILGLCSERP